MRSEPFVWHPRRLWDAHDSKAITYEQFALGTFVTGAADYRTQTLTITISELKARMHHTRRSDDSIRRDLHALKAGGWLDFDVEKRQREPWVIRLTGLLVREAVDASTANSALSTANSQPDLRQTTTADGLPQTGASSHGNQDGEAAGLPQADSASSTSTSLRGEDVLGREDPGESEPVSLSLDGLDPDVKEKVGKARAARAKDDGLDRDYVGTARPVCGICGAVEFFAHNGRCKTCGTEST